jgi:hypothetical protein
MTTSPEPGGPTGVPRHNDTVLDQMCRIRDGSRRIAAALLAAIAAGAVILLLISRLDSTRPLEIHGAVPHATILRPR